MSPLIRSVGLRHGRGFAPVAPGWDEPVPFLDLAAPGEYDAFALAAAFDNGRIVVVGRRGDDHFNGGEIVQWTSVDGGHTYSDQVIYSTTKGAGWENRLGAGGGVTPSGRIVVLVREYNRVSSSHDTPRPLWSDDLGHTWTVGAVIAGPAVAYGPLVVLPSGRLMQTFITGASPNYELRGLFSDDDGETWGDEVTIATSTTGNSVNEPAAVLVDGATDATARILIVYRNQAGAMHQVASTNGGLAWGAPVKLPFSHDDVSGSERVDVSPWAGKLDDGRIIMVWADRSRRYLRWTAGTADVLADVTAWEVPRTIAKIGPGDTGGWGGYPWGFKGASDASFGVTYYEDIPPARTSTRLYQRAVDVTAPEPPTHELLLSEGSGSLAVNSGSLHDGTIEGATWEATGLAFDGVDDGVTLPALESPFDPSGAVTLVALAKSADPGRAFESLIANLSTEGVSLEFQPGLGLPAIRTAPLGGGSQVSAVAATAPAPGEWVWVAGVLDPATGQARIYVNGAPEGSVSYHGSSVANATLWRAGRNPNGAYLKGSLALARAYPLALDDAAILARYVADRTLATGRGIALPAPGELPDFTAWAGYVDLTIPSGTVAADLVRYPLYVDLSTLPAAFWAGVKTDGGDVRAASADGSAELPTDLVTIDAASQSGELHVLVPQVTAAAATSVRIYYGNATASRPDHASATGRNAVWRDYRGVWHLQDDPTGSIVDSTGRGNDGSGVGTAAGDLVPGALAGRGLGFAGASYVTIPDAPSLDITRELTLQAWAKVTSPASDTQHFLVDKTNGTGANGQYLLVYDNRAAQGSPGRLRAFNGLANAPTTTPTDWLGAQATLANWTHLAFVQEQSKRTLYGNGAQRAQQTLSTAYAAAAANALPLAFGRRSTTTGFELRGALDEVRISAQALSAERIAAEHLNQSNPAAFYSVSP